MKDFTRQDGSVCTLQKAGNHSLLYEVQKGDQVSWEVMLTSNQSKVLLPSYPSNRIFRNKDSAFDYFQLVEFDCTLRRRVS